MLEEADVVMTEAEAPDAQADKCPATAKNGQSSTSPHLSVDTNISLCETAESSIVSPGFSSDYTALSPSDIALLDGPGPQPSDSSIKIPKVEDNINPFSPSSLDMDTDMFPALQSSVDLIAPQTTVPLPNGPVRINGIYYQPIPTPRKVVVATSSVSEPSLVAVVPASAPSTNEAAPPANKPKVGLEFAMPEQPPAKKTGRR